MTRLNGGEVAAVRSMLELKEGLASRFADPPLDGIDLTDDEVDELVELVTNRLATHGFDASYSPTDEGVVLERLIDRLTSGS